MQVREQKLLWELIVALGIPIVANVATKLLEKWFGNLDMLFFAKEKEFIHILGLFFIVIASHWCKGNAFFYQFFPTSIIRFVITEGCT
jgi:NAD-dependent DNA ligase